MPDTRVAILSDVDARIRDHEDSNIIWIKGFPGVGKSTLASTIVSRLRGRGELLSYFVFDRAKPTVTTTTALWRRVAWNLARVHPFARQSLLKHIDDETLDVNSPNISSLFTSLIIEPLSDLSEGEASERLVVVIDGADECGGLEGPRSNDRKALLKTLERWHLELPKNFKLVITSREEAVCSPADDRTEKKGIVVLIICFRGWRIIEAYPRLNTISGSLTPEIKRLTSPGPPQN